jgi:hypothetical protein
MTPKKPDWFELTENGDSYAGIQKMNKKLPIATLVAAGAIILGGSIFATANNEPSAVASTPSVTSQSLPSPTVTTTPQRGDDDERGDGRERDHEDRDDD